MKYFKCILLIIFLAIISNDCIGQHVSVICGTFNQPDKIAIQICEPIDGYFNNALLPDSTINYMHGIDSFFYKTNKANTNSFFTIIINNKETGERIRLLHFLVIPGDSINIKFDFTRDDYLFAKFSGSNARGNMLYSKLIYRPFDKYMQLSSYIHSLNLDNHSFLKQFNSNYDSLITQFKDAYKKNEISEPFFFMMKLSINMDLVEHSLSNLFRENQLTEKLGFAFRDSIAKALIKRVSADSASWIGAANSTRFLITLNNYRATSENKLFYSEQLGYNDVEISIKDSVIKVDKILAHLTYIKPKNVKEVLWFYFLFDIFSFAKGYFTNNDIIKQYDFIFPHSKYTGLLENEFNKRKIEENISFKSNRPIIILDSSAKYKTLKEIVENSFSSKSVFIDLWASWCKPCVSEFVNNQNLDSILDRKKVEKLYISFDQSTKNWLRAIDKYKLGGFHVLLNQELYDDLKKLLNISDSMPLGIPHYLLFGKDGNMAESDAPRPSDKRFEKLIDNLRE